MERNTSIVAIVLLTAALASCEKEITVDLPETEQKIVVEGVIEVDQVPFVILTRTQSFFAPTDLNSISSIFVRNALVTVFDGSTSYVLDQICSSMIPDSLIPLAASLTGLDPDLLASADICVYTKLDQSIVGEVGKTYDLQIEVEGRTVTSSSKLPVPVPLDSVWFRLAEQDQLDDTSGYVWARLSDPAGVANYYRWSAKRISLDENGEPEDDFFISPFGSAFNDQFFDGLALDFFAVRGNAPSEDDGNDFNSFFLRNDTVVVRFISYGEAEYDFYRSFENNVANQGDLFSTPANVRSNIVGGLGIWAAIGTSYDTLVCIP